MTGHGDVPLAVEAMKAGAVDFIEKPFDDEVCCRPSGRRSPARPTTANAMRGRRRSRSASKLLSEREREVLDRLVAGKPNKVIAYELGISPRTVEIYRANVMTKMQADSLSELVRMALIEGGATVSRLDGICAGSKAGTWSLARMLRQMSPVRGNRPCRR